MNKDRRKAINALADELEEFIARIEELRDEERDYFDAMPESFQGGEKGEIADAAISNLDDAESSLTDTCNSLREAAE